MGKLDLTRQSAVTVRRARKSDMDCIRWMHRETFDGTDRRPLEEVFGGGTYWVVEDREAAIAVGFAGMKPSSQFSDCVYLHVAGVMEGYRGRGLQKRLIKVRCAGAKRAGMAWAVTDTTNNPPSANSLIACGFRLYEPSKPWSGARNTLYWRKLL